MLVNVTASAECSITYSLTFISLATVQFSTTEVALDVAVNVVIFTGNGVAKVNEAESHTHDTAEGLITALITAPPKQVGVLGIATVILLLDEPAAGTATGKVVHQMVQY